jgi:MOSC domain-containing protein
MQTGPSSPVFGHVQAGSVAALWRYPVKSMMGEELNACDVTERGLLGDRQFAVVDRATGKVGGAKNPAQVGQLLLRLPGHLPRATPGGSEGAPGPDHSP